LFFVRLTLRKREFHANAGPESQSLERFPVVGNFSTKTCDAVAQPGIMHDKRQMSQSGVTRVDIGLASGGDGIAIEHAGRLHVIGTRPFVIGRSPNSDLVVDHAAVSRRHARIVRGRDGYWIEDMESRNGVCLDAHPVRGSARLIPGMVVTLGDVSLVVRTARRTSVRPAYDEELDLVPTPREEDTSPVDRLLLFMTSVDEALLKGETRTAERAFARHLGRPSELAAQRGQLEPGVAQTIALLSLRLGEATSSSAWLDFVVRLYSATATVVPLTVVNAMQALARKLGGVDRSALRQYASILEERAGELTIEERCVLDRLAALATSSFSYRGSRAAG
jgi:pSer/pThr/pTyr-binding forkhead associated (FHA) protein